MEIMLRGNKKTLVSLVASLLNETPATQQEKMHILFNLLGNSGPSSIPVMDVSADDNSKQKKSTKNTKKGKSK